MKRIVLVSKETLEDNKQMENIILDGLRHPGGRLCLSGMSLELTVEQDAMNYINKPDTEVFTVNKETGKLSPYQT